MHRMNCVLMSALLMIADGLTVHGPSGPLVAPLGSSVVLPCSVDELLSVEGLEVEWRRTDSDTLVHLYQDGESRAEAQQQDYQDRAHFITEEIQRGNFSLRLDNLRAEDDGRYTCTVFSQQESGETVVEIKVDNVEHLRVSGSSRSISASVGEDVTLSCSVDSHISPEELEVSWMKTDEDGDIVVLLFQNNKALPEATDERYRDRVEFFTAETPKGNFSLRLKSVRTEDKGVYMCEVFAGGLSANTTVVLERLGFSVLHIMVLVLCISASGSALLLCCLIYCRSPTKELLMNDDDVPLGGSVDLACQVDKSLLENSLKVEWRRADSENLVHLYQDGKSRAEEQHQDYHKRAHFSKKKIKDGNFSLRLKKLRAGDEGVYTCQVYREQDCVCSVNTELKLGFIVKPSHHTSVPLGSSVVLPCYNDKPSRMESLKVEWSKKGLNYLVHLYEDGESQADKQQQDYQHRAHFFTEHLKDGNFSLRLDDLRAEDEGRYTCTVHSGLLRNRRQTSTKINLVLKLLETVFRLQMFLVFCPNVLMFLAFVLWGVSEGSLFETVSCCTLYFLRPLMLLWTAPYVNDFTGKIKTWVLYYSFRTEYIVFSAVFYSVLFKSALDKSLNYSGFEGIMIIVLFVIVILFNLIYIIFLLVRLIGKLSQRIITIFGVLANISFDVLPSLQFILLFFSFGSVKGANSPSLKFSHWHLTLGN
ncbi:butyrophilin-like protein 2 [Onychostoma macrolepis]|uniref:butyrophilin-like protein 2 n=1 Tax=Onychostoma macrolepis TaxID=369639 RepID=UPI00272A0466|nr:butyrophilin-like protein 2 [Onychostoma macrolepis]